MNTYIGRVVGLIALCAVAEGAYAQETLRLGMTPEPYMPFTQVSATGEWQGLEADLSRALCKKIAPVTCEFKSMAWDGLIPSLTENKVDFIIGAFAVTEKRRQVVDFSKPYYRESTALVGAKADNTEIGVVPADDGSGDVIDAATLAGKIVGAQTSSVQSAYASKYLPGATLKNYDTMDNTVADLVAGRVDYVLGSGLFLGTFLKSPQGADYDVKIMAPRNIALGQGIAYAVRKGDKATLAKVDAALSELEQDGTLKTLVDKWFETK